MNDNYTTLFQEIGSHLDESKENNAKKLLEKDELLETEMNAFEASLSSTQVLHWNEVKRLVGEIRMYAKLAKLRLMDGDENLKSMVDRLRTNVEGTNDEEKAALEISREMHEYTGVTGILKSLLMWKPSPEERLDDNKE